MMTLNDFVSQNKAEADRRRTKNLGGGRRGERLARENLFRTVVMVEIEQGNRHSKRAARARRRPMVRVLAKHLALGLGRAFMALKGLAES